MQLFSDSMFTVLFTAVALLCQVTTLVLSSPWMDAFETNQNWTYINGTSNSTDTDPVKQTSPYFICLAQAVLSTFIFGFTLFVILIFFPRQITQNDRDFPLRWFIITGSIQAVNSVLINYSLSGTRTPTYLTGILLNFNIPLQFIIRYLIIRKRPSLWQFCWAGVVMGSEFICLLPTIFPGLEPESAQHDDGGASGATKLLWCMVFVSSLIPGSVSNVLIERYVKAASPYNSERVHIIYYTFYYTLGNLLGRLSLFWTDIVPGFGLSENITVFAEKMWFNVVCLFGQEGCGAEVVSLAWANLLTNTGSTISVSLLLRYSEGSNYYIVAMTLKSPITLLIWTLFDEHPFIFHPHFHLSTMLGIVALIFMVPAVIFYNIQPSRMTCHARNCCSGSPKDKEELLVNPDSSYDET